MDRGQLATERVHPASLALDALGAQAAVDVALALEAEVLPAVAAARDPIAAAVELCSERLARGGRLIYVGAGTSGRLATLDAAECPPTFGSSPATVQAVIAGGPDAVTSAVEGAEDDQAAGRGAMDERALGPHDVAFGISAGGTTPFVHAALARAAERGAATIFLACVPAREVPDRADVSIRVVTGPELVAGSTRLKAGTATKIVLNMVSTLTMARLGKVHAGRMVDVDARANEKLVDRAQRLVMDLGGVDRAHATTLLEAADWRVKPAVLMARTRVDADGARARLAASGDSLRRALADEATPG